MDGRNKKFILELQKKPKLRKESGLYTVDGPKMAGELEISDIEELYVTRAFLSSPHAADCGRLLREAACTVIADSEMKQISDTVTPQGILVVAKQRKLHGLKAFLEASERYRKTAGCGAFPFFLILETLQDPGNLGTILRAAEAAGVTGVLANAETADLYSPKVVRSTMGAILRLPYFEVEDLTRAVETLKSGSLAGGSACTVYAAHLDGAVDYTAADYRKSCAVMIGNESRGLSDELTAYADQKILIPMCGKTESLNAAVAASVISFEAARQRRNSFQ